MTSLTSSLRIFFSRPLSFFFVIYAVGMLVLFPVSGTNPRSRLALEASLCASLFEGQWDYSIDALQSGRDTPVWTMDWAQTPDGKYYSNKAPGPSFLALPLHCAVLGVERLFVRDRASLWARHFHSLYLVEILESFFLQILPCLLMALHFLRREGDDGRTERSLRFCASWCFGTTAALFMNTWFGHGITSLIFVATLLAYLRRRWFGFGFGLSALLLCDYACVYVVPPLVLLILCDPSFSAREKARIAMRTALASLPAFALWAHYHGSSFGAVTALPQQFQNPIFVDNPEAQRSVRAVLKFFPDPRILVELLLGSRRGVLVTQPWIFVVVAAYLRHWSKTSAEQRRAFLFVMLSFLSLLALNASFGQWHSGGAPGPRYMSAALGAFACLFYWIDPQLTRWERRLTVGGLAVSLLLFALTLSTTLTPPPDPLWPTLARVAETKGATFVLRFGLALLFFAIASLPWWPKRGATR